MPVSLLIFGTSMLIGEQTPDLLVKDMQNSKLFMPAINELLNNFCIKG